MNDPRLAAPLAYRTETLGQRIALGNSREPPAFKFPSRTRDKTRYRQVLRYALKRLPSSNPRRSLRPTPNCSGLPDAPAQIV